MQHLDLYSNVYSSNKFAYNDYSQKTARIQQMKIVEDLYNGKGFNYFTGKYISDETVLTLANLKTLYMDRNYMNIIVSKIISFCPTLNKINFKTDRQLKLFKKFMKKNNWLNLFEEIYYNFEMKGDNFAYVVFENEEDTIPKFHMLKPECMKQIVKDENNNPKHYIYREYKPNITYDYTNGNLITSAGRYITYIFSKDRTILIDENRLNKTIKFEGSELKITDIYMNRNSMSNMFALVHIPSFKRQNEDFSNIPAANYADDVISISKETTNINQINMQLGFPVKYLTDGTIIGGNLMPGSHLLCRSNFFLQDEQGVNIDKLANPIKMEIKDFQITNSLTTLFENLYHMIDCVYEKAGLIPPSLEAKLGSTDSSRVIQQLRSGLENKVELYVDQIIQALEPVIKVLMIENDEYIEERDYDLGLIKPDFILKNSPFDQQLYDTSQINSGIETVKDVLIKKGVSLKEIEEKEISENKEEIATNNEIENIIKSSSNVARISTEEDETNGREE